MPSPRRNSRPRRRAIFERLESRLPLAADITTGLVHHWTFDETSGDTAADSAGDSDGTLNNWTPTEPKWEPGRIGGALRFDTNDNYVVANPAAMSGSYSVSFWLNVKDRSVANPRIFQSRVGNDIYASVHNNRNIGYLSNGAATAVGTEPLTFNTWEHYALKFNAATGQGIIYRSGVPVAIGNYVDTASLADWIIGHSSNPANHNDTLRGAIDDLRVYDRLLTDEDVAALGNLGTPEPTHPEPIHHWTFDETTGFTAFDSAGNADAVLLNWNATEPRWVNGKVGGAVEFSTPDNVIVTPPAGTHAQWSVAFWINLTGGADNYPRIITPKDDRDLWAYLGAENGQGVSFRSRDIQTIEPGFPPYGVWSHYAINFDTIADVGTIYRDGVQVASGFFGDNSPAQSWIIGHNPDFANHQDTLQGLLDDLRVYDRLLAQPEIDGLAAMGQPTPPPPSGLIHHWTFDETSGDIAEDVAGDNDGQLRNFATTQIKWVPGKIGGAIHFTSSDDLVITEVPVIKDQYTFSFWLNQTGDGGFNPRIINPGDGDWITIGQFGDNGVGFEASDARDPNLPTRNTWEHYAVTLNRVAGQAEVYRSGVKVASGNFSVPPPVRPWVMGHSATVDHHIDSLHGMLDDMRVYDYVLSASEIQQLAEVAVNDAYTTNEDLLLDIATPQGLLANDTNAPPGSKTTVESAPLHGDLVLNEDGSFTYDPDNDYNGPDTFTYRLTDPQDNFLVATVALTIRPVNDAPSFDILVDQFLTSDEQPRVIEARNISFDGLSDHLGHGDLFTPYTENGFDVIPATGRWLIMTTSSPTPGILGNPSPAIWEDTFTATLEVTRSSGEEFEFSSIDLVGAEMNYTLIGFRGDQEVFSKTAVLPATSTQFVTIPSPSTETIDRLRLFVTRSPSQTTTVDNIKLVVSKPSNKVPVWFENLTAGPPTALDEASQVRSFEASNDNNALFADQPFVDHNGTLYFTPAPNASGTATVTVTLEDDGGTALGGVDSTTETIQITIVKPHPRLNAANAQDVLPDGTVAPNDALEIINFLNAFGSQPVSPGIAAGDSFLDVTGDNVIAPDDALEIINALNAGITTIPDLPGSASFVGFDTTTQGNWQGQYGSNGYALNSALTSVLPLAKLSFTGGLTDVYTGIVDLPGSDPRALQIPGTTDRIAATWSGDHGFTLDINIQSPQPRRVAFYMLDILRNNRSQRLELADATTGQVLDARDVSDFGEGKYLVWNLSGHVKIRFTNLANGLNAVLSGIFFD